LNIFSVFLSCFFFCLFCFYAFHYCFFSGFGFFMLLLFL